jgi:hypothetical protein
LLCFGVGVRRLWCCRVGIRISFDIGHDHHPLCSPAVAGFLIIMSLAPFGFVGRISVTLG